MLLDHLETQKDATKFDVIIKEMLVLEILPF